MSSIYRAKDVEEEGDLLTVVEVELSSGRPIISFVAHEGREMCEVWLTEGEALNVARAIIAHIAGKRVLDA